ncbi:glycosyltransferase family 4 protein [Priestia megaterium]|uniref:glycosyltransferase family 4 protein n=2 Tax=Bacillaceae TaxID=186817 RepID=UPI003C3011E9
MSTVVNQILESSLEKQIVYIPTHYNGNKVVKSFLFLMSISKIVFWMFHKELNIVHIHMSEKGSFFRKYIVFKISKCFSKKIILHTHGADFEDFYLNSSSTVKNKIRKLLRGVDIVIALGEKWKEKIFSIEKDSNVLVLRNAISIPSAENLSNYNSSQFNILFLGVLIKRKGVYELLEGFKQFVNDLSENEKKNVSLVMAGSGEEEAFLKQLIGEYNLEGNVKLTGWINTQEKERLLSQSQLFILPSYNEGLPMAILEAMSYGLPIVSTDVGSVDEAVHHHQNGYLIEKKDIVAIYDSLNQIYRSNSLWNTFSDNSRYLAEKEFDLNNYYKNLRQIYLSVLK